jgi:mRNA interferase MazF
LDFDPINSTDPSILVHGAYNAVLPKNQILTELIDSSYSTVICAPVFTQWHGLRTQVSVSTAEGLKHKSAIQCDGLTSLETFRLTDYVGELASERLCELDSALLCALGLPTRARPAG